MIRVSRSYAAIFGTLLLIVGNGTAHAGRFHLGMTPHSVKEGPHIVVGATHTTTSDSAACANGSQFVPIDSYDYITPENGGDSYYAILDPAACTDCGTTAHYRIDTVHISLYTYNNCSQPIDVTIVAPQIGGGLGCPMQPNQASVIAGPYHFDLPMQATTDGSTAMVYDLPLPQPVVLNGPAYLGFTMTTFNDCRTTFDGVNFVNTELVYGDSTQCQACKLFNYYVDSGGLSKYDYCVTVNGRQDAHFKLGPTLMWATGTCTSVVPVLPASWGQLKVRYASPRRRRRRRLPSRRTRSRVEPTTA